MVAGLTPRRILEIGVGEGHVMTHIRERFPGRPLVGLDLPDDELGADWRARGLPCMFGDATTLPFPDDSFDLVLAIEVLEHVARPDHALAELSRVCSGTFVASVPFEPIWRAGNVLRGRYVKALGNTPGHVNHWTRWGFRRFVESRFHVQQVRSPMPWTMTRAIPR
jgi:SAM-dependent methyltransferase